VPSKGLYTLDSVTPAGGALSTSAHLRGWDRVMAPSRNTYSEGTPHFRSSLSRHLYDGAALEGGCLPGGSVPPLVHTVAVAAVLD